MTDDQLRVYIERQETRARRSQTAQDQAKALDYYLGRPNGTEEEGSSSANSSDVYDVVEGMTPLVIKPFVSSDEVVSFNPEGPEDEEAAKQETDYINYIVTQKNDAFEVFTGWVKAGLMQKNGVVKYWWDQSRRVQIETYLGQSDDVYTDLISDPSISVIQHSEYQDKPPIDPQTGAPAIDPQTGQPVPGETLHDVKLRIVDTVGAAKYEVLAPEEFIISGDARSPDPKKANFCEHITRKSISALREMGYDVDDDIEDTGSNDPSMDPQATARITNGENLTEFDGAGDPSMREVWFREAYCLVDYDGDGIAEARKICIVGTTVLENEEIEEWPFAGWTPVLQLSQFDGRCPADETIEIQDIKTTLLRQNLNNIYTINNNRTFIGRHVNIEDMLDNQIAGIVRVNSDVVGNQAVQMGITPIGDIIQPMMEYFDAAKENRTGFSRYNQGSTDLGNQKTLGEVRVVTEASSQRIDLIARSLAEIGMKPLMLGIHGLCRRHATKAETIRLRGKWVTIDPRQWKTRTDMSVSVGLGTADKSLQLNAQDGVIKMQAGMASAGIVSPENQYNACAKFVELTGEKNPDKYFTHPDKMPKPQPPDPMQDPQVMFKVTELKQKDRELDQADRALDQVDQKQGIESQNAQQDALVRFHELQLKTEAHARSMAGPAPGELQAQQQQHSQSMESRQQDLAESQAQERAEPVQEQEPM